MKFLILGSNSFSGSHCVKEALLKDNEVIGISRSVEPKNVFLPYKWDKDQISIKKKENFEFFQLDLNKDLPKIIDVIYQKKPEYIINFA